MLIFEYSIGRCDTAIDNLKDVYRILLFICINKSQEYHHISIKSSDIEKLAFFGPDRLKYTLKVVSFSPRSTPYFYTAMIYQFQDGWTQSFRILYNKQSVQYNFTTYGQS